MPDDLQYREGGPFGILRAACQREEKSEREFAEDEDLPELHKGELHGDVRAYEEKEVVGTNDRDAIVYILTNFNTTIEEDLYRVKMVHEAGFSPDIRIYRKAPPRRF